MSPGSPPAPATRLRALRDDERALAVAFAFGLVATVLHPAGLAVGGGLAGALAGSLRRAAVLGLEFGGTVLLAWAVTLWWFGTLGPVAGLWPISGVALAVALAVPSLAALAVRGLG